jgi:hypothetical protein
VVRFALDARKKVYEIGEMLRIGYYSQQDGLSCIWLVDCFGKYCMTADHEWLTRHFEIVFISDESAFYGKDRLVLLGQSPNRAAAKLHAGPSVRPGIE